MQHLQTLFCLPRLTAESSSFPTFTLILLLFSSQTTFTKTRKMGLYVEDHFTIPPQQFSSEMLLWKVSNYTFREKMSMLS